MNVRWCSYWFLAIVFSIVCAVCFFYWPKDLLVAWLTAAMLVWSRGVGSLTLLFIMTLTGGRWGEAARPWLQHSAGLLPLSALLFSPWLLGIEWVYPWTDATTFAGYEHTEHRVWFYQSTFFMARTLGYFAIWVGMLLFVNSKNAAIAGLSLVAILLSVTWAAIDWILSFDPFFTSTLLGVIVGAGAVLSAFAYAMFGLCSFQQRQSQQPHHSSPSPARQSGMPGLSLSKPLGDLSGLLLALLLMWAYLVFSQFLIMWSGDLPTEAHYYLLRSQGGWQYVTPALVVVGFALPFGCLLSYRFKRSPRLVGRLALLLISLRLAELAWMILPADDGGNWRRAMLLVPATGCVLTISEWRPFGFFNQEPRDE